MELTQQRVRELFNYRQDGNLVRRSAQGRTECGDVAGYPHPKGYLRVKINQRHYLLHRLIYLWHFGVMPKTIDHKNGNKLDNRIANLREATTAQNAWNSLAPSTNSSGKKGVSWNKKSGKWIVRGSANGARYLGMFDSIEEAELAYLNFSEMHHGEFARAT